MNITRLFTKSKSAELDALRSIHQQNETDRASARAFGARSSAIHQSIQELTDQFAASPSLEVAERLVAARLKEAEIQHWDEISVLARQNAEAKIRERTAPKVSSALKAILDRLRQERAAIIAKERAIHAELGELFDESQSALVRAIDGKIREGEGHFNRLNGGSTTSDVSGAVRFCLAE